jgi:DNA-directed RNA polymerase sigma subunit (sigma70/sigma32)
MDVEGDPDQLPDTEHMTPEDAAAFCKKQEGSLRSITQRVLGKLTPKEREILEKRFGPNKDPMIQKIEQRALEKLGHGPIGSKLAKAAKEE